MKNTTPKERLIRKVKSGGLILAIGLAYYVFVTVSGFGIPCVINKVFDIYCTGCGISRMFVALFHGDIRSAAEYNLFALIFIVPALIFTAIRTVKYVRHNTTTYNRIEMALIIFAAICAIVFTVLRNLPQFSYLAPA